MPLQQTVHHPEPTAGHALSGVAEEVQTHIESMADNISSGTRLARRGSSGFEAVAQRP